MGGIVIFAAISIPFLILTDYDAVAVGVSARRCLRAVLGFADDWTKIVQAPLARASRPHEAGASRR